MKDIKHIYWFAPYNLTCPSTRYRGKIPLDYLKKEIGITYDFVFPNWSVYSVIRFLSLVFKIIFFCKKTDLIVIQKVCSNRVYANLLKLIVMVRKGKVLYDLDDAEYLRQPTKTLHFFLKHCTYIQVGSEALKAYCLSFNQNVKIATSPVYQHCFRKTKRNDKLHIGWVGDVGNGKLISRAFSHKHSLTSILFPIIKQLPFPVKLSIIGIKEVTDIPEFKAYFADVPQVELNLPADMNWETDAWLYDEIKAFDIGVAPLVKHPFNEAKSAFKSKQYLSCGVPTIASDVGENRNFIFDGENGFLAKTSSDFAKGILEIANMDDRTYSKYVVNAQKGFPSFSIATYCKRLLDNIQ